MAVFKCVVAAWILAEPAYIDRAYDVVGRSHPLTIVGRQNIIPVDHPDMIAVNAILGLELPIAIISICLRPGDDLDLAVGILIDHEVDELLDRKRTRLNS